MANYELNKTGVEIDASLAKADLSIGTNNTGITSNGDLHLNGGNLTRSAFNVGHLEGGQVNIGDSSDATNPIYTIGSSTNPGLTTLSNMFGVGYSGAGASFLTQFGANVNDWGMYVAADGDARLFLDGSTGTYYGSGAVLGDDSSDGTLSVFGAFSSVTTIGGTVPSTGEDGIAIVPSGSTHTIYSAASVISSTSHYVFINGNGTVGSITTNGTATAFNVSSDERLKENFEPITDAFDLVKSIVETGALQYFTFKADPGTKVPGFVAQRLIACGAGGMVAKGEGSLDLNVEIGTVYQEAIIERTEITEEMTDSSGNLKTVGTGEFTEKVITPEKLVTPCGVDQSKAVPHLMQLCYDQEMKINALIARLDAANI